VSAPATAEAAKHIVAEYPYHDQHGVLLFESIRFDPKAFSQRRPNGNGGYIWNLDGVERVPYRLSELLAASPGKLVFIPEGEKDVDNLRALGLVATCNSGGAGNWRPEFAPYFTGRDVVILPDNDGPGLAHAEDVARSLFPVAARVCIVCLAGLPPKGDVSDWLDAGHTKDELIELAVTSPAFQEEEETEGPEVAEDGAELLCDLRSFIRRFVFLSEAQATIVALWIFHTWAIDAADATPYLHINSAEKQSGKTRLLEVLELLVANPWLTGRLSAAVLIRKTDALAPTLLLDESDAAFNGEKEYAEALRGILNTGYLRGGKASMCVGQGAQISYKDFSTFSPKAIAGIGHLPDTVEDRSIPILLKRAAPGEVVERFRRREVAKEAAPLRKRIEKWCESVKNSLALARPSLPDCLSDRQQDVTEPLLAVADAAGGEWPEESRAALTKIFGATHDDSIGVRLLADIRMILDGDEDTPSRDRIGSADLADALSKIETSPWGEWSKGKPITTAKLARQLSHLEIAPGQKRIEGSLNHRGYDREDFADSWLRYLPRPSLQTATVLQPATGAASSHFSECYADSAVAPQKQEIANTGAACSGVALSKPLQGDAGETWEGEM